MKKFFLVIVFFILINNFILICAEENSTDYSKELGLKENAITGSGVELEKTNEGYVFRFNGKDPTFAINGNKFENIKSSSSDPGEIVLDKTGKVLRAKFSVNEKGGSYNIDKETQINAPPNSIVSYERGKNGNKNIAIVKPEKSSDIISPVLKNDDTIVMFEGSDMKMNENSFSGKLSFDEKGAFIDSSETVNVNNVRIGNSEPGGGDIRLFFDGEKHEGNFVSIGDKNIYINSEDSKIFVEFLENNPYARIDKNDVFGFEVGKKSQVELKNRDELGLIPLAITRGENIEVLEDAKSIFTKGDNINLEILRNRYISSTTSPVELFMAKPDGSDFLGVFESSEKVSGYKILVDNFNRLALIPKDSQEGFSISENINTLFSAKVSYNYPREDELELLTGKSIIMDDILAGSKDESLGRLRDYWASLNDETKASIGDIKFLNPQELGFFSASTEEETRNVNFKPGVFGLEEFSHEAAHALELDVRDSLNNDIEIKKINAELDRLKESPNLERQKELMDLRDKIYAEKIPFERDWMNVAGPYDKFNSLTLGGTYNDYSYLSVEAQEKLEDKYGKGWSQKARLGYIRPYGAQNIMEDVATFVEKSDDPNFFKPLLNTNSPDYNLKYRQKIDILYNYGFISKSKYQAIISGSRENSLVKDF